MNYNFDELIDRANTNSVNYDGYLSNLAPEVRDNLKYKPEDMIRMWIADMDFATPDVVLNAIHERVDRRILGYTGIYDSDYYQAFASWTKRRYNFTFPQEQILFSHGIVPAIFDAVKYICNQDDKVLILTPSYGPFQMACDKNNVEAVWSALRYKDGDYEIDFEDVEHKVTSENIKACIFCNPHNPTGRLWTEEELTRFGRIMAEHDVWIISDEIHCDIHRQGQYHIPFQKIMPDYDKMVTMMSQSKAFNIAGLMFANVMVTNPEIREQWRSDMIPNLNPLSIAATQAAYEDGEEWLSAMNAYLDGNFEWLKSYLAEQLPETQFTIPQATYLAWIDVSAYTKNVEKPLAQFFMEEAGVIVEDNSKFVANAEGHIRLNLTLPRTKLQEGLERIVKALKK